MSKPADPKMKVHKKDKARKSEIVALAKLKPQPAGYPAKKKKK